MKKCPECAKFMEHDDMNDLHYICNKCDMFYCFEGGCHCCDEYKDEKQKMKEKIGYGKRKSKGKR